MRQQRFRPATSFNDFLAALQGEAAMKAVSKPGHRFRALTYLSETPLSEDQVITLRRVGDVDVTATVVDSVLLRRWIKGFGDRVWNVKRVFN